MNAALNDFRSLEFSTKKVSLYESLLVGSWLLANNRYPDPKIDDADHAVAALFEVLPGEDMGRLRPCRYAWQVAERSGRKTVWNNTTRGKKLATSVFLGDDLREGLLPNAAAVAASNLAGERLPSLDALARWLSDHRGRQVTLVGHTDAQGSLTANIALSKRRAQSVADRLVSDFGIERARVSAEGAGYLAPRASNDTEEGRHKNRRVEVMLTPTR